MALDLIRDYSGDQPLHLYLKHQFRKHRHFGSRDRKMYADLIFAWHRTGNFLIHQPEWKIAVSALLLGLDLKYGKALAKMAELSELSECLSVPLEDRYQWLKNKSLAPELKDIFPVAQYISPSVSMDIRQFFRIPYTWFRIPGEFEPPHFQSVRDEETGWVALMTDAGTDLEAQLGRIHPDYVIQDLSSQIAAARIQLKPGDKVWDCCAGSGGKSLFLADRYQNTFELWASDVRENILQNLQKRFSGRKCIPHTFVKDLSALTVNYEETPRLFGKMDVIIADVPCSGSGTWRRNPEQLVLFKAETLNEYAELQYTIVKNALPALNAKGTLYYLTCSIYAEENEENVRRMEDELGLRCMDMKYLNYLTEGADIIFMAKLTRAQALSD